MTPDADPLSCPGVYSPAQGPSPAPCGRNRTHPPHPLGIPPTALGDLMPDPNTTPVRLVDVFGNKVDPKDIAAQYVAEVDGWVDMPEARPRARCQAKADDPNTERRVFVMADGELRYDKTDVRIDVYPGEQYAPLRAENEARWAALDKAKDAGR